MNPKNKTLSVVAFYLSEYDLDAVKELGFRTRTEAIQTISERIGNGNNYLKLRRDEFDVLPDSSSPRKGWRNRPPLKEVSDMAEYLHTFSFDELSGIVKSLINNSEEVILDNVSDSEMCDSEQMSEEEIESIVNFKDPSARLVYRTNEGNKRIYNRSVISQLKMLYRGCCQICGVNKAAEFGIDISEVHHIRFFADSQNNDSSNLIVLCPDHHRIIHKMMPDFDPERMTFKLDDKMLFSVTLDYHLKRS